MKCKLTGSEGNGINAHIIPRSFYAIDPDEKQPTRLFSNANGHFPKRCPIGIYDNTIVTEEGERVFSQWDDYGTELLLNKKSQFEPLEFNGEVVAFQIPEYDYNKLKLFFLSVLWRASVSDKHFFRRVNLGPHEAEIKNALLTCNPQCSDWYAVSLAKWSNHEKGAAMMDPYLTKFEGINYYVMYLEKYIAYFKVDKRIPKVQFQSIQLTENKPLIAIARELDKSKEHAITANIVRMHRKSS